MILISFDRVFKEIINNNVLFRGQNKETGELKPFAFMIMKKENSAGMLKL